MAEYRQGFLKGVSEKSNSPTTLLDGRYDFVLLSSSWDRRCLSIAECASVATGKCALTLLSVVDSSGLRDAHDRELTSYASRIADATIELRGDSCNIRPVWLSLMEAILSEYRELGRPLRLLVDLSSCPRYLSLGLICDSIQSGLAAEIDVFYAEGNYPEQTSEEHKHELFTAGGWDAIPIPSLEGQWSPEKNRAYVVSVGFEGSKTLRLISRAEPDRIYVLFPDPGVKDEYVERTWRNNEALIARLGDPSKELLRANAGDAIETWQRLDEASVELPAEYNYYYACCGTKPHSLALALRAAVLKCPAVLYIVPDRHKVVDVEPLGVFWKFSLRDMTSLRERHR